MWTTIPPENSPGRRWSGLRYADTAGFDVLLVFSLDRLARDPYIRTTLEMEFERLGVKVEPVLNTYDDTPEGDARKNSSRSLTSTRTPSGSSGLTAETRQGGERAVCGGPGAVRIPGGQNPTGRAGDRGGEAAIVRFIFEQSRPGGQSIRGIAETLGQWYAELFRYAGWGKSSVARILSNETYAGTCYYNKFKRRKTRLVPRDRSEWIAIPVPAIVERSLFDTAQARLKECRTTAPMSPNGSTC